MVKIEAWSLEEAYTLASKQLGCSITEIECEIVQTPSRGFFGIGRKKAILVAVKKQIETKISLKAETKTEIELPITPQKLISEDKIKQDIKIETPIQKEDVSQSILQEPIAPVSPQSVSTTREPYLGKTAIDSSFFKEYRDINEICEEIEEDINNLFERSCFDLERIRVEAYDAETVLILFSGHDSALLIGKEGYRYKALSYLIFNWINSKYGFLIRLEIAEFLKNQEEMIKNYLDPLVAQIKETRRGHTKPLDGVLIQIALKILREEFTELYVGVKTNSDGSKYIIVNEFYSKQHDR